VVQVNQTPASAPSIPSHSFDSEALRVFVVEVFLKLGCHATNAETAAEVLLASDLRGIESHGVARLAVYEKWLVNGLAPPNPEVEIVRETGSTATVDGGGGLGIMVAPVANRITLDKADKNGSSWVAVRNSNHFGIAGFYVSQAVQRDMVGWAMSNATAQVTPARSKDSLFGTNPFAVGIPAGKYPPFIADMATSVVAYGKIEIARRRQTKMPFGWALDQQGNPTDDPNEVGKSGRPYSMLPLGSDEEHGIHKGYCLAAMVDILSGVLGNAAWGPFCPHFMMPENSAQPPFGKGLGHLLGAMRIDAFDEVADFKQRMDLWVETVKQATPIDPELPVMIPGEPEFFAERQRRQHGIPLLQPVVELLQGVATRQQVEFPAPLS